LVELVLEALACVALAREQAENHLATSVKRACEAKRASRPVPLKQRFESTDGIVVQLHRARVRRKRPQLLIGQVRTALRQTLRTCLLLDLRRLDEENARQQL